MTAREQCKYCGVYLPPGKHPCELDGWDGCDFMATARRNAETDRLRASLESAGVALEPESIRLPEPVSALDRMVGESPYRDTTIQPWQVWDDWDLNPWEASIAKRLKRWRGPGGKGLEDLRKMQHELEYLIEREEGELQRLNGREGG